MKLITWNINSVRLRAPIVLKVMGAHQPDVICLQETKCPDEHFPFDAFREAGYEHIHIHGMKGYNGQAILSKLPFEDITIHDRVGRSDCRHIAVRINGIELHNLYIPAGGDEPDVEVNDKFAHKLDFVDEMAAWFKVGFARTRTRIHQSVFFSAQIPRRLAAYHQTSSKARIDTPRPSFDAATSSQPSCAAARP